MRFILLSLLCSSLFSYLRYEEFEKSYQLGNLTTEQSHPITENLSSVMHSSLEEGLRLLNLVDKQVIKGFEQFVKSDLQALSNAFKNTEKRGGRVFLLGSGSSGRVAIDLAAKMKEYKPNSKVIGVIAGGDTALIKAKEGFEDSIEHGYETLKEFSLDYRDSVVLLSASGSASFNVGCANYANEVNVKPFYFYNSKSVPDRTQSLFDKDRAVPIVIDIGPQAISGSTRLQAATLAEVCLGAALTDAFIESVDHWTYELEAIQDYLSNHFSSVVPFIESEWDVFSNPEANFRKLSDESSKGYVTWVSYSDSIREILIDTTETAPTFSTNPPRRFYEEGKKQAEFCAYLLGDHTPIKAWEMLLNREIMDDPSEIEALPLNEDSLNRRNTGYGNAVFAVVKDEQYLQGTIDNLKEFKNKGAKVGLISLVDQGLEKKDVLDAYLNMTVSTDPLGILKTVALKQILNMISNSSMVLMNKVDGNRMIDVKASNNKLIDRTMRLCCLILNRHHVYKEITPEDLYNLAISVEEEKNLRDELKLYTPSTVKLMVTILQKEVSVYEAIDYLMSHNESLEELF